MTRGYHAAGLFVLLGQLFSGKQKATVSRGAKREGVMAKKKPTPDVCRSSAPAPTRLTVVARRYAPPLRHSSARDRFAIARDAIKTIESRMRISSLGSWRRRQTSTARLSRSAFNCEKCPTLPPCDVC